MGKCLVTKLNAVVDNDNILHIGEVRIKIAVDKTPSNQFISLSVNKETNLEIIGDSYFTDSSFSNNLGKSKTINSSDGVVKVYFNNATAEIAIRDKYSILDLSFGNKSKSVDLSSFSYAMSLKTINSQYSGVYGDISNLKKLKLSQIYLSGDKIYGDIASLKDMTTLTRLNINDVQDVYGDLSSLRNLTNLELLYFNHSGLTGSIDSLKPLTKLTSVNLENLKAQFTGNIESLSGMTKLSNFSCFNAALTGDLAKIPASCTLVNFANNNSTFTWSSRPAGAKILTIQGSAAISNLDAMLIDQASRDASAQSLKIISVRGTRTSASDTAVATLQSKGYTVSII